MTNLVVNIKPKTLLQVPQVSRSLIAVLCTVIYTISAATIAHEGHIDKDAQLACTEKALRESCEYVKETGDKTAKLYSGYCQKISHNKLCVRNQPIKTIVLEPLDR